MSEIALVSARKARLEVEAKRGNKSAKTALKLANEPDRFLSTIQIGITLIGILTGLYSGEAFAYDLAEHVRRIPFLEPYALVVSKTTIVVIVTYLTLIMGELVPKRIGMGYAERVSMLVAKPMNIFVNTFGRANVEMTDGEIAEKIWNLFDMRPKAIEERLKLRNPIYLETASYGHMGRKPQVVTKKFTSRYNPEPTICEVELFTWEKLDYVDKVKEAFGL